MRSLLFDVGCAAFLLSSWVAHAQGPTGRRRRPRKMPHQRDPVPAPAAMPAGGTRERLAKLTRADVEAWLDGFMPYELETSDIAGAVVVVVKDGAMLYRRDTVIRTLRIARRLTPSARCSVRAQCRNCSPGPQ